MEQITLIVVTIAIFRLTSGAQIQALVCLNCNDVSSPKHCQDVTICGQGEICSTHEFIDYRGLRGYRLGCENHQTCELVRQANILFGKRDVRETHTVHPDRCYECCPTDECNRGLCEADVGNHSQAGVQPTVSPQGVICKSCQGVESPEYCRQTTICGDNEICFTREYSDHGGIKGFRMGCESRTRCSLFLNAASLFGKRHLPEPAPPEGCYNCCSSDECNTGLCRGSTGGYFHGSTATQSTTTQSSTTQSTTTQSPQTTTLATTTSVKIQVCPPNFAAFKENCYHLNSKETVWSSADAYCKGLGAGLLSLHSREENNFIAEQMRTFNVSSFWTGGILSSLKGRKFEWMDGSHFNYTNWYPTYPHDDGCIAIGNPGQSIYYHNAPIYNTVCSANLFGSICKKTL